MNFSDYPGELPFDLKDFISRGRGESGQDEQPAEEEEIDTSNLSEKARDIVGYIRTHIKLGYAAVITPLGVNGVCMAFGVTREEYLVIEKVMKQGLRNAPQGTNLEVMADLLRERLTGE